MNEYHLWADGACQPNPGVGGWAFYLLTPKGLSSPGYGSEPESTNNRMELTATLEGLKEYHAHFYKSGDKLILELDSKYVLGGLSEWSEDWIKRNWYKKNGKPVLNADLWKQLIEIKDKINIEYRHVHGHTGNEANEFCDRMAVAAIKDFKQKEKNDAKE